MHELIAEMRSRFGETAKTGKGSFGFYLGCLNRIGYQATLSLYKDVLESTCDNPGKLFWWKFKKLIEQHKKV